MIYHAAGITTCQGRGKEVHFEVQAKNDYDVDTLENVIGFALSEHRSFGRPVRVDIESGSQGNLNHSNIKGLQASLTRLQEGDLGVQVYGFSFQYGPYQQVHPTIIGVHTVAGLVEKNFESLARVQEGTLNLLRTGGFVIRPVPADPGEHSEHHLFTLTRGETRVEIRTGESRDHANYPLIKSPGLDDTTTKAVSAFACVHGEYVIGINLRRAA